MWRNYWTVAVRALAKSKTYSVINIAGLAIGMAACIMILLYINYERSYDKWLPDADRVYQVQSIHTDPETGQPNPFRNLKVRQAMNYAVDKDAIVKNVLGTLNSTGTIGAGTLSATNVMPSSRSISSMACLGVASSVSAVRRPRIANTV